MWPMAGMVSMRVVQNLVNSVAEAKVSPAALLRATPLDVAGLGSLDRSVPRTTLYQLIERALELTGDPALGLHSMEKLPSEALDPIAALVNHSSTWQEAMSSVQEFRGLLSDDAGFRIREEAGKLIVQSIHTPAQSLLVRRFLAEITYSGLFRVIQRFRAEAHIDHISFEYSAPSYVSEYTRIFRGLARFDQPQTSLRFDPALMTVAAPYPDAELHQTLSALARRRLLKNPHQLPYSMRVYQSLIWQKSPRDIKMSSTARSLGVSVRTLRRYLTAEAKSYADIVNEALVTIAKTSLRDERRTIMETALDLGFADNTSFHRAFKRWTGLTPMEYQRENRAEHE